MDRRRIRRRRRRKTARTQISPTPLLFSRLRPFSANKNRGKKRKNVRIFDTRFFFCFGHTLAPMYRIVFFVYVVVRSSSNVVVVVMVMMAGVDGGTLLHRFWFTLLSSTLFSGGGGGFRVGDWGSFPFFICPYHSSSSSSSRRRGSSMQKKKLLAFCCRPFQGCFGRAKTK